jgi:hypothetical protein
LHFVGQPDVVAVSTGGGFALVGTGEVAGAGRTATALLTATATVTTGCINRGDNEPRGLERTTTQTTGSQTFNTRSGRGTFSVQTNTVPTPARTCPSRNMTPTVVSAEFTDITLTVTSQTGTTTATFPDLSAPTG